MALAIHPRPRLVGGASLLTAAALLLAATASAAGTVSGGGVRSLALSGAEAASGVVLPDALVISETDSVWIDGTPLVRGEDYGFDESGTLLLAEAPDEGASVLVRYRYLPFRLEPVYRRALLDSSVRREEGPDDAAPLVPVAAPAPPARGGLSVGGAKTFGITLGSERDLRLEQSLRLNVSGRIAKDLRVNAYLSDQNTPLVPEGDTEELRTLDKVLIEIEGEHVAATMGDYELDIRGGALSDFSRELTGAMIRAGTRGAEVTLAGARAAGEFTTLTFRPSEGKQGPYLLTDDGGATGVTVVAGSEKVWLDGESLRRGRDNDYVIDYASGEIEFTEKRPVTSDNEVTVDYEYGTGAFERDVYGGRASASLLGGAASVGVSFFREADDRDASTVALGDDDVSILAAAGDDVSLAHDDGVDSVGVGLGDYSMLEPGVFEYAGADSGEYDLDFERSDGGDYAYDYASGHYVHVGEGEGDYVLGQRLPMPEEHQLAAVDGRWDFARGAFVEAEAAVSSLDLNTFSDLGDDDNLGNAAVVSAGLPAVSSGVFGGVTLELEGRARRVGGKFRGVGRYREVGYADRWSLEGLALPDGELVAEGVSKLTLKGGGRAVVSVAQLEREDALDSRKVEFSLEGRPGQASRLWGDGRVVDLEYRGEKIVDRARRLYRAGAEQRLGPVRPGVEYRHDERVESELGESYDEYGASIASAGSRDLEYGVRYAHRLTDRNEGNGWDRASTTRTEELWVEYRGTEKFAVDGRLTRRRTDFTESFDDPSTRSDVADVTVRHRSLDGGVSGQVRYSVTSTEVEEREKFVYDEDGAEVTKIVSTGRFVPVTELSVSSRWDIRPGSLSQGRRGIPDPSGLRRLLAALELSSDVKLAETSTTAERGRLYLLDPALVQGDETVTGRITSRHVLRYLRPDGSLSARLSFRTGDRLDRSYVNASEKRRDRSGTLDVKLSPGTAVVYRAQTEIGRRDQNAGGVGRSYEVVSRSHLLEITATGLGALEAGVSGRYAVEDERLEDVHATAFELTPTLTYRVRGKGSIIASMSRTSIEGSSDTLPLHVLEGRSPGVTTEWRLTGDYRLNRYITGSISYSGRRAPGSAALHTVDVRMNAFF